MATTYYAWSDLYGGGKTKEVTRPGGVSAVVVESRNIVPRGEKVSKSDLKISSEDWDRLVEGGSVRPYPVPDNADESVSPARAIMQKLVNDTGDIDPNVIMELAMKHPPAMNPPAEDEAELPAGV